MMKPGIYQITIGLTLIVLSFLALHVAAQGPVGTEELVAAYANANVTLAANTIFDITTHCPGCPASWRTPHPTITPSTSATISLRHSAGTGRIYSNGTECLTRLTDSSKTTAPGVPEPSCVGTGRFNAEEDPFFAFRFPENVTLKRIDFSFDCGMPFMRGGSGVAATEVFINWSVEIHDALAGLVQRLDNITKCTATVGSEISNVSTSLNTVDLASKRYEVFFRKRQFDVGISQGINLTNWTGEIKIWGIAGPALQCNDCTADFIVATTCARTFVRTAQGLIDSTSYIVGTNPLQQVTMTISNATSGAFVGSVSPLGQSSVECTSQIPAISTPGGTRIYATVARPMPNNLTVAFSSANYGCLQARFVNPVNITAVLLQGYDGVAFIPFMQTPHRACNITSDMTGINITFQGITWLTEDHPHCTRVGDPCPLATYVIFDNRTASVISIIPPGQTVIPSANALVALFSSMGGTDSASKLLIVIAVLVGTFLLLISFSTLAAFGVCILEFYMFGAIGFVESWLLIVFTLLLMGIGGMALRGSATTPPEG